LVFFIRAYIILFFIFIFVLIFLAEPLAFICMFLLWFSVICTYNIFVDILRINIEIIKCIRSKYKIINRDIGIDIPSLIARISVIILSNSLVLSKVSRLFLYLFIYLSRVLASITIILVLFWAILLILLVRLRKVFSIKPGLQELLFRKNKRIVLCFKYIFFCGFLSSHKGGISLLLHIISVLRSLYKA
jgi:hypothetical protein